MPSKSLKSFKGMITEGSSLAIPEENCSRMVNCIALENKFLTRKGYKKYNSVPYPARINLIYQFKRVVGGTLNIIGFGDSLFVGTPFYDTVPSANAGIDQTANTDDIIMLNGTASERVISYLWTQTSGTTVTLSDTTSATPTFTMPAGDVSFQLQVTNSWGSDTDTVDITNALILITNCVELQAMQDNLSGHYKLANDIDCTYCTQNPAGALYNGGAGFAPIETFTGIFDGNGYTITGLYINRPSTDKVGLFGYVINGEIKNIGMIDVDITGNQNTGALTGVNRGTVTNCYSTGAVSGGIKIGGLVGFNFESTVINCYSTGNVSGDIGQYSGIGGLVGYNNRGTVTNCYSTGNVSGDIGSTKGGLVGEEVEGIANNDFWDTETSGQATSAGGTGKTTAQMKQEATFTNWNFTTIWAIVESVSYPTLR